MTFERFVPLGTPMPYIHPCGIWQHGGAVVSAVASQLEGHGFKSRHGPFCVEFVCSPRVCVGFLRVLRFPPTVEKHAFV